MIDSRIPNISQSHPIISNYGFYFKTMHSKLGFRAGFSKINLKISSRLNKNQLPTNYINNIITDTFENSNQVDLDLKLSYYEMPLEFNYAIKKDDNPITIDIFTGFSLMVLDENNLYLSSNSTNKINIGDAKNVSKSCLSYNLGIGFGYKLTEKIQIDLNPSFKYYLTMLNEDNTQKPYSLSIQSGITYKL